MQFDPKQWTTPIPAHYTGPLEGMMVFTHPTGQKSMTLGPNRATHERRTLIMRGGDRSMCVYYARIPVTSSPQQTPTDNVTDNHSADFKKGRSLSF